MVFVAPETGNVGCSCFKRQFKCLQSMYEARWFVCDVCWCSGKNNLFIYLFILLLTRSVI